VVQFDRLRLTGLERHVLPGDGHAVDAHLGFVVAGDLPLVRDGGRQRDPLAVTRVLGLDVRRADRELGRQRADDELRPAVGRRLVDDAVLGRCDLFGRQRCGSRRSSGRR